MNAVLRIAAGPALERLGGLASRLLSPPADAIDLPTYPTSGTASHPRRPGDLPSQR